MEQYISKSALVAEIERLKNTSLEYGYNTMQKVLADSGKDLSLGQLQYFLDTLEVKDVDLEKELKNLIEKEKAFVTDNREVKYYNGDSFNHIYELEFIAKHFFELGLKAQKGE